MTNRTKGKVYLVGAGPGRADLITVRGAEILRTADCVIYDRLANPALLKFAASDAEIIHVPKRIGAGSCTQEEINNLLLEKAKSGKTVVRLKGGDPCVFGRGAEELAALTEAGIDFEIVPGVTAATAAAAYTGIVLTDRTYSSQVVFVTGREADDKAESNIDWNRLARFGGTIVFYMAMGRLEYISRQLMENGMKENTPAAVIANATMPSQSIVRASLKSIVDRCADEKIGPPAIVIVGTAADSDARFNWFMKKPLFGKNIVVTRDARGNADFAARIIQRGGNPIDFDTITIKPLTQTDTFLQTLAKIADYDWVIFTSANGVRIFFDVVHDLSRDSRVFRYAKIAAIGSKTAAELRQFGIRADFVPTVFTGKELAKQLIRFTNLQRRKILLLRSELASKQLPELLEKVEAKVDDVAVYSTLAMKGECERLTTDIAGGAVDWLTFTSPSAVKVFFEQIPGDLVNSSDAKVASIGPVTSDQLRSLGVGVDVQAANHTIDGLLTAIELTYK